MLKVQRTNEINIREARALLNKLSDEVVLNDSYFIITVRNKPKSILVKYDEKLIQLLDKKKANRKGLAGEVFASGMNRWLKSNSPIHKQLHHVRGNHSSFSKDW